MQARVWTYNLKAGEVLTLSPKALLIVSNTSLAFDSKHDTRSSLELGHGTLLPTGLMSKRITVATLYKNKSESVRLDIKMRPDQVYTLAALGDNDIDLYGYIPGPPASPPKEALEANQADDQEDVKAPVSPKKPSNAKKEPVVVAESISSATRRNARAAPAKASKAKAPTQKTRKRKVADDIDDAVEEGSGAASDEQEDDDFIQKPLPKAKAAAVNKGKARQT
ncbi:hypothetical protein DFP72DRAFT_1065950 [Ephemerocybe angulata]|uniref:Nucleoplasmin-like domain-containing protein n=1 Tax=Ephemerocybe angulata TaxID=980116 RepID=A0A8H6I1C4_9AGAR|nr:hypothetical protein DFP72DRAFT_1065950 [Tulosesus angulatus]